MRPEAFLFDSAYWLIQQLFVMVSSCIYCHSKVNLNGRDRHEVCQDLKNWRHCVWCIVWFACNSWRVIIHPQPSWSTTQRPGRPRSKSACSRFTEHYYLTKWKTKSHYICNTGVMTLWPTLPISIAAASRVLIIAFYVAIVLITFNTPWRLFDKYRTVHLFIYRNPSRSVLAAKRAFLSPFMC